mmetsp:Transcript_67564/g.60702  ORF Transcript_67564/g.60702 Transcript_67564/m.60702 type:complete len:88 (+) Transcript_67564:866-1129(+)
MDHNYLSYNNEGYSDIDEPKGDSEKEVKFTLNISPWILYVSSAVIIAFIALNYALCYYRNMSKNNKDGLNTTKLRYEDEKIPLSDDA